MNTIDIANIIGDGRDIYRSARAEQGRHHPLNGCCFKAATLAAQRLTDAGIVPTMLGPKTIHITNRQMVEIIRELGPIDANDRAMVRRLRNAQALRGGKVLSNDYHYWIEAEGFIVDCALPDVIRRANRIVLTPLIAPIEPEGVYAHCDCEIIYSYCF